VREIDKQYEEPSHLVIQLGYKDLYLGGAIYWQYYLNDINTGDHLDVNEEGIILSKKVSMFFSVKMQNELNSKLENGYVLEFAEVTFKVYCLFVYRNIEY